MSVTLATTYHDPADLMYEQIVGALPALLGIFDSITMQASPVTAERPLALLREAGVRIRHDERSGVANLGAIRRAAVAFGLEAPALTILFFDFDSMLHWFDSYPDELAAIVATIGEADFTLIGRTPRAMATHPRFQLDTELLVNAAFARLTGYEWDVMRSGRALSRRAAAAIVASSRENRISTDIEWPLLLLQSGGFTFADVRVEGTEFETQDRYSADVQAAGGYEAWLAQLDSDPQKWAHRVRLSQMHLETMLSFVDLRPPTT